MTSLTKENNIRPRRSFIFTPGLRPDMFPKALASGADMVCVELEDGIAPKDKDEARQKTLALFTEKQADDGVERLVRINSIREAFGIADVQAILATDTPPPALMVPKVKSPDEVILLDNLLTERGHETRLHIIIETNQGLESAFEIAHSSSRIDSMLFGGIDMAAELRCDLAWESLLYARSRCVHAAASAGIDVIDVPYLDLEDPEGMQIAAEQAKSIGFSGKGSIHPKQIHQLNKIFTPSKEEIAYANKVIKAFNEAIDGLVVVDGKLIEKPVLRTALKTIANSN
jgi:(S)-citramalyl-CoA lyase